MENKTRNVNTKGYWSQHVHNREHRACKTLNAASTFESADLIGLFLSQSSK